MDTSKMILMCTDDFDEYAMGNEEYYIREYNEAAEHNGWERTDSINCEQLREYFDDQMNIAYDYFIDKYGDNDVLVIADIGRWDGRYEGGKYGTLSSLMGKMVEDNNSVYFDKEKGTFIFQAIHHDGTNYFTIYKLNEFGKEYLEENGDWKWAHKHVLDCEEMTERFEL